ncbi:MAG: hypothetical protein BRC37_03310 [Cyanobacteria bacterium QH_3_48_40]|nr:MAG: hypothetical protein BRC37_03310 [Cyanobacteria bacterium QH_3_48_40]
MNEEFLGFNYRKRAFHAAWRSPRITNFSYVIKITAFPKNVQSKRIKKESAAPKPIWWCGHLAWNYAVSWLRLNSLRFLGLALERTLRK